MNLNEESESIEKLLKGKIVQKIFRHRENEFGIEFTDGSRIFIDKVEKGLELSITGVSDEE